MTHDTPQVKAPKKAADEDTHSHLAYLLENLLVPLAVAQRPVHPDVLHLVHRRLSERARGMTSTEER